jgi:carbon-monoxide dehydrogenase small subunit
MKTLVTFHVNGEEFEVPVAPTDFLVDVIRERIGLTGTKKGCGIGDCGACTVLVDGEPVLSCLTLALSCEGREVTTIEGLGAQGELHPVQRAFVETGAIQCGFCTPGMILSAKALLDRVPNPTADQIQAGLAGNICRCTGYVKILEAVQHAARLAGKESSRG